MAIVSKNSNTWLLSAKILLVSTAVLTAGVVLKLSVPVAVQFMVSVVPVLWNSLLLWLAPPYLYVVINGIIIMIVASSRYTQKLEDPVVPLKVPVDPRTEFSISATYDGLMLKNSASLHTDFGGVLGFDSAVMTMRNPVDIGAEFGSVVDFGSVLVTNPMENRPELQRALEFDSVAARNPVEIRPEFEVSEPKVKIHVEEVRSTTPVVATDGEFDDFLIKRSTWMPIRMDAKEIPLQRAFVTEKPSASIRFSHRKPMKASPEAGRTLGVSKPKRHDTLESTWKTITDGRPIPLARHLKKSDTWETHGRHHHNIPGGAEDQAAMKMKKSETFNERGNKNPTTSSLSPSPGSGKLKKEPSLSQDELNRRVEAFIKKFNEDMRLQRQESLNQYKEMVKRG